MNQKRLPARNNRLVAAILICLALLAATASAVEYSPDAKMILPKDYRQWVFLSSGIGMSYLSSGAPGYESKFRKRVRKSRGVSGISQDGSLA